MPAPVDVGIDDPSAAMNRLLVYGARVGDLVLMTPALRLLAGQGSIDLLARPWARPLLDGPDGRQAGIARLDTLADFNAGFLADLVAGRPRARLTTELAARGYDEVIAFHGEHPRVKSWITGWAGAQRVRWITFKSGGPLAHRVDAARAALEAAGIPVAGYEPLPRLDVTPASLEAARARLAPLGRRVLAVQAGSSLTNRWFRRMPNLKGLAPAQWATLIARILNEGDADAAIFHGGAPEGREAQAIIAAAPAELRPRLHDWTGRAPLGELPALFAAHHAVLSVDTGPAHIAAAVGAPLLVVFGPTDPRLFAPRGAGRIEIVLGSAPCQFCHNTPLIERCRANVCLTSLPAERLWQSWRRLTLARP